MPGLPEGYRLEMVSDPAVLGRIFALRVAAWRKRNRTFPDIGLWTDPFDEGALHWAVQSGRGEIVAAARMTLHDGIGQVPDAEIYPPAVLDLTGSVASINRLVVCPTMAGMGLVAALDDARIEKARSEGCRWVLGATLAGPRRLAAAKAAGFVNMGNTRPYRSGPLSTTTGQSTVILLELTPN